MGYGSWMGYKIRRKSDGAIGKVTTDSNGRLRVLTVEFPDGSKHEIIMDNFGDDSAFSKASQEDYQFYDKHRDIWYDFLLGCE